MNPEHPQPPSLALRILSRMAIHGEEYSSLGDLEEEYNEMAKVMGVDRARFWFWIQILKAIPAFTKLKIYWSIQMFKNYMKIAIRNIKRHKGYSFINIFGLAVGITCCILIFLWVQDEFSYDKFHENGNNLYLVGTHQRLGSRTATSSGTPPALGPAFKEEYPEIVNSVRFCNGPHALIFAYGEKRLREYVEAVDGSLLEMFTFPLLQGNPKTALTKPHSLVMTERMAQKYFNTEDALGKIIRVENKYDFEVTGVLKNLPHNSLLQFDCLVPIQFLKEHWNAPNHLNTWYNFSFTTFVQLHESASPQEVEEKTAGRINKGHPDDDVKPFLRPYTKLYLYGLGTGGGRITRVRMLSLIAVFVLLIACINFMNLTTARSGNRAKEIGMRKVTGALRWDIIKQFYGESILMAFFSLVIAVLLVILLLPVFNNMTGKELTFNPSHNLSLILGLLGTTLLTGLVAGSYPALFMSSFQPVKIMRDASGLGSKSSLFRKILVVLQFAISVALIIQTFVIFKQLKYMRNRELGFNREHLVYIPVNGALKQHYEAAKQELQQVPGITQVSLTSRTPLLFGSSGTGWDWEGKSSEIDPMIRYFCCDFDFVKTFEMEMVQGRFFSRERTPAASPQSGQLVINEGFARIIGEENPVGMRLSHGPYHGTVIGVINDFNYWPLYYRSGPLIIFYKTYDPSPGHHFYRYIFARIRPDNVPQTIASIEKIYKKFNPEFPFTLRFLDDDYSQLYRSEEQAGEIFRYFAILAVLISCLGLFGLASFLAEQRTKEIGIRKVLGSSVQGIIFLLSKQFLKWVAVANIIALPIAWYLSYRWLQNYPYRTITGVWVFILTAALTLVIALLTVSYKSIKAARSNPVDSLRYE
jgi:putative ABC transport system permease protein